MWARHGWVPRGACWGRLGSDGLPRCWNARAVCTWITLRAQRTREVGRGARNYWQGRGTGARRWRSLLWQRCCSRRATAPIEACRVSLNRQVSEWVVHYFARSLWCLTFATLHTLRKAYGGCKATVSCRRGERESNRKNVYSFQTVRPSCAY